MKTRFYLPAAKRTSLVSLFVATLLLGSTTGCNEYWRTRGQPPSVDKLLERSQERLTESRMLHEAERVEVSKISTQIEGALTSALKQVESSDNSVLLGSLQEASDSFIALEGKVSIGSRAALGELSGQLRRFSNQASQGEPLQKSAFGLFTARTMFFLANELSVPAPNFG